MTPIRLLMNSPFSGANAFFALAEARGLFSAAGLAVECIAGRGAYTAAGRLQDEGFDAAYGDLHALVEQAALQPAREPALAVCIVHRQTPSVIAVDRRGPVHSATDLPGLRLIGHASDVALQTFGIYAAAAGLREADVQVRSVDGPMAELLRTMLDGQADGVFGYATTHTAALASIGLDGREALRFLRYRAHCPCLYGSALMASPTLIRTRPQAVRALVGCLLAAIDAARREPDAAIAAAVERHPDLVPATERLRWRDTLRDDIDGPADAPAGNAVPPGDCDDTRLVMSITRLAAAKGWSHPPPAGRVFTRAFLPGAQRE